MAWEFFRRGLFLRNQADREWREEMEANLQIAIDALVADGMSVEEARAGAMKRAGNLTARREEIYRMNGIAWLDSIVSDLQYALRGFSRDLSFTLTAILTLAIGIGANTAVFSVVNSVLLKPLAYPHPEELIAFSQAAPGAGSLVSGTLGLGLSPSMFFTYRERNTSFQAMGAWTTDSVSVTGVAEPEQVKAVLTTDGVLEALAVGPALGRWLLASDQVPDATETVVLSHGYWERKFGGEKSSIGRKILVDGRPREIVGVMPAGFRIADVPADLMLPLRLDRRRAILAGFYLKALARLKAGVSLERANADITQLVPIWMDSWPSTPGYKPGDPLAKRVYTSWRITPNLRPLRDAVVGDVGKVLWVIMGTLGIVLLIASANVANLLLVRADARRQELAIRAALGAGWARIVRQLLVESLLLGAIGGAAGLGAASAGLYYLLPNGPSNLPRLSEIALDSRSFLFTLAVTLFSSLVFGLIPSLKYAGSRIALSLRGGGRTMSESRERHSARNTLVVVQVALAIVLLISSGLMIRTFRALRSVEPGFTEPGHVQTFRVSVPRALEPDEERTTRIEQAINGNLAAIPGVRSVGFANALPMDGSNPGWDGILTEGQSYAAGARPPMRMFLSIAPGSFAALGTRLIAGRDFAWDDMYNARLFVMVSENLARELWGSPAAAIGKRVHTMDTAPWREVIGVVQDVRHNGVQEPAPAMVYWPIFGKTPYGADIEATRDVAFAVRSNRAGTGALLNEIRQAVGKVNGALPVAQPETLQDILDRSMARTSFALVLLTIAGVMALLLGVIGIYGVIAYAVSQRTREIGIRLAIGARPGHIRWMFLRYGLRVCTLGAVIGLVAAAGLTQLMSSLLFGVEPVDPITFAAVPLMLILATVLASYLPARRASAVDPVEAIKEG